MTEGIYNVKQIVKLLRHKIITNQSDILHVGEVFFCPRYRFRRNIYSGKTTAFRRYLYRKPSGTDTGFQHALVF